MFLTFFSQSYTISISIDVVFHLPKTALPTANAGLFQSWPVLVHIWWLNCVVNALNADNKWYISKDIYTEMGSNEVQILWRLCFTQVCIFSHTFYLYYIHFNTSICTLFYLLLPWCLIIIQYLMSRVCQSVINYISGMFQCLPILIWCEVRLTSHRKVHRYLHFKDCVYFCHFCINSKCVNKYMSVY